MPQYKLKPATIFAAIVIPTALVLLGAGCFATVSDSMNKAGKSAGQIGDAAVQPMQVDAVALQKAKDLAVEQDAKTAEQNEAMSDDVTVAYILTENAAVPADAKVDTGVIGCNDRVAFEKEHRAASTDSVVNDALVTLFSVKDSSPHALYDALASSSLSVDKIQSIDGVTTEVWLKGKVTSGGACDTPRIKAQIESTIKRFKPHFKVILNGDEKNWRCLGDVSGQCK